MIEILQCGRTWDEVKIDVPVGTRVEGVIKLIVPFGLWIDAGLGFVCLMLIPECGLPQRGQLLSDVYAVGGRVVGNVIWHNDAKHQLNLSRRNIVA